MSYEFVPPPGCTQKHGSWYAIIRNQWHRLCRVADGPIPFWRAYYRLTRSDPEYMAGVLLAFLEEGIPERLAAGELAPSTAAKYEAYILLRLIPYCGRIHREDLTSTHVAIYLSERKKAGAPIAGNRERACLSSACAWAMGKGWMSSNPCHGVRRNMERESTDYVPHESLVRALDRASPELYALMGIAYVTGIRQTDLRLLREEQDRGKVIVVTESKTGKPNEHEVTPTVRYLLDCARQHKAAVAARYEAAALRLERLSQYRRAARARARAEEVRKTPYLFVSHRGLPWSEWGLQSALRRFGAGFRFRQLRAKAQTDAQDRNVLGHAGQMLGRYIRRRRLRAVK
jgi:hypothetical protein